MLQRLLVGGARISGEDGEAVRAYVREQLRITRPEEVEPFRRWSDIITYYQGTKSEPAVIRNWLLPATRYAHRLTASWASRCAAIPVPANATGLHELRSEYYRSGERWLMAMVDSLEHTLSRDPWAKRRHHAVAALATKHTKARVRAEQEMQKLVGRLA